VACAGERQDGGVADAFAGSGDEYSCHFDLDWLGKAERWSLHDDAQLRERQIFHIYF
jgi:hypothetical protein